MVVPTKRPSVLKEYGRLAPEYDRRWSFYIEATLRETLVRLRIQPRDHVLDVGCGTGMLLEQISAASPQAQLSGMDPSAEMLQIARGRLGENVNLHEGYAESLPFPNAAFDVVVSTNAFHYFRDPLGLSIGLTSRFTAGMHAKNSSSAPHSPRSGSIDTRSTGSGSHDGNGREGPVAPRQHCARRDVGKAGCPASRSSLLGVTERLALVC